ncbi:type VI secretion protein [Streptomyces sp. CA-135486]|uniref:type IV secretory system conjugative DNA transfer family protein n=1 Tax=Streptomyces sp. CA-135486 TaxID=3240049 RepID=UPI003D9277DD
MRDRRDFREDERGIPDGLLVGLLGFLLGLTLLVWTATGLAGVLSHGAWPRGVTFTQTPMAMRALASKPHDLAGAWPDAPPAELSGYGLFWGLAIGELMVLLVLTIFVLGTAARWRAVRANRPTAPPAAASPRPMATGPNPLSKQKANGTGTSAGPIAADAYRPGTDHREAVGHPAQPEHGTGGSEVRVTGVGAATTPPLGATGPNAPTAPIHPGQGSDTTVQPGAVPAAAYAGTLYGHGAPGHSGAVGEPTQPGHGSGQPQIADHGTGGWDRTLPAPRTPRILYGDPATRRPAAVRAVLDAAGPVLLVTSDPAVWAETKDARAKLGPVLLYDPGHLCDTPARLHWSPTAHCEDATTAQDRATALLAPVRPRALLDAAMADTAETLLRCWLHAAAVDGRPFKQLHRWAQGGSAHDAVRILRTHPKATAGLAGLLESALTAHPERREIAQQLVVRALSALSSIHIREACTPNRTDSLTLESFINEGGTLYLMGESIEDPRTHPGAMPLLTALASDVVEHGRRMAARSSDGRLDPPMTLVLDDVAAVAPLPRLPELLATGQDQGLPTLVLLRSAEQARARWPEPLGQ